MPNRIPAQVLRQRSRSPRSAPTGAAAVLTIGEAANYVGVRPTTFWNLRKDPTFPPVIRLTERLRGYLRADLDAWIEARRAKSPAA